MAGKGSSVLSYFILPIDPSQLPVPPALLLRFLTISERLSALQTSSPESNSQPLSYRNLGANGSSSNVFPLSEEPSVDVESSLVGTGILNVSPVCDDVKLLQNTHFCRHLAPRGSRLSVCAGSL